VQEGLVNGDASLNLPKTPLPPELNALYNDPEKLRDTIKQISSAGSLIADLKDSSGNNEVTRKSELTLISDNEPLALTGLDKALTFYTDQTAREVKYQESNSQLILGMSLLAALCVWFFLFRPMARSIHLETSQLEEAERMHRENNERQTFRNELSQALEVADTEGEVLATVGRAFLTVLPANPVELFLADESQSHLRRAQVSPEQGAAGCPVDPQRGCAAVRRGHPISAGVPRQALVIRIIAERLVALLGRPDFRRPIRRQNDATAAVDEDAARIDDVGPARRRELLHFRPRLTFVGGAPVVDAAFLLL
jgi:hypothetical protein